MTFRLWQKDLHQTTKCYNICLSNNEFVTDLNKKKFSTDNCGPSFIHMPCSFYQRWTQRQRPIIKSLITATYNTGDASMTCFRVAAAANNKLNKHEKFQRHGVSFFYVSGSQSAIVFTFASVFCLYCCIFLNDVAGTNDNETNMAYGKRKTCIPM